MSKVAILGAGIAGISAGFLLKQRGIDFVVIEQQPYVGGLARSFPWNGFPCDFAAHRLFTHDEHILSQLLNLVPMGRHIRRSALYLQGKPMRDPLDVLELVRRQSLPRNLQMLGSFLIRNRHLPQDNFENFVVSRYGRYLYELFFRPYTEKLFGISGAEVSSLWGQQKVRLANPLDKFFENTKNKFQYFYYPLHGAYGAIVDRLYAEIQDKVLLNSRLRGLTYENTKVFSMEVERQGQVHQIAADHFISTLPITVTGRLLGHPVDLAFQKVDAVYLHIGQPMVSNNHWVYFIDDDIAINRLVEFKNMSQLDKPPDSTVICAEVTQKHHDPVGKVIEDLVRVKFLPEGKLLDSMVIRENHAYPVYQRKYNQVLSDAQSFFNRYDNLYLLGRASEFRHREVDDNFSQAAETVALIAGRMQPLEVMMPVTAPLVQCQPFPLIHVVILSFNNYGDTQECLASVARLAYPRFRIVLVDNGSTDGTSNLVRKEFPEVTVIENFQNLGVPSGYNVGFQYALNDGADFIFMLNNDTVVPPDLLDCLLDIAKQDAQIGILMPKVLCYGTENEVWSCGGEYRRFPPAILMTSRRKNAADEPRDLDYAPSCGLLIRKAAFEKAGLFDPGYFFIFDDWDFSERIRACGMLIRYVPTAKMWHKISRTTQGPTSPLFWRTWAASSVRFYRRHGHPVLLSLAIHIGYMVLREFVFKRNGKYWKHFRLGIMEGLQKPLGQIPGMDSAGK